MVCKRIIPFRINYKFKDDDNYYTCLVTEEQFQNFQALPPIEICMKDKEVHADENNNIEDVEVSLDLAKNNDISQMKKLSDVSSLSEISLKLVFALVFLP